MGNSLRDVPGRFSFNDTRSSVWDPVQKQRGFTECPDLPGLWLCRSAAPDCYSIGTFAESACGAAIAHDSQRCPHHWRWFGYDPARRVAPVLLSKTSEEMRDFEVFGGSHILSTSRPVVYSP